MDQDVLDVGLVREPAESEGAVEGTGGKQMSEGKLVYTGLAMVRDHLATKGLGKNQENKHQGFKFRGIDDLYGILQPALAAGMVVMAPSLGHYERKEYTTANGKLQFYTMVTVEYHFTSLVDGSTATFGYAGEAADTGDKSLSKALTMAFKSFCFHVFQIPLNGNDDADKHTAEEVEAPKLDADLALEMEAAAQAGTRALRNCFNNMGKEDRIRAQRDKDWYDGLKAIAEANAQSAA